MPARTRYMPQVFALAILVALPAASQQGTRRTSGVVNATQICISTQGPLLRAGACPDARRPLYFADGSVRRAAGAPVCWWHADPARLADIRGVGPALSGRIAAFRDEGGRLADIQDVRGVGPTLHAVATTQATEACARVPMRRPTE